MIRTTVAAPEILALGRGRRLWKDVADGVHRIEDGYVNWYLIEEGDELTAIDAGLPVSWQSLQAAVAELGHALDDLAAVVLTHAHVDHMGFAEQCRRALGVSVFVHTDDAYLAHHPWRWEAERSGMAYLWRPMAIRSAATFLWNRALSTRRLRRVETFGEGQTLEVPGGPVAIHTPGHTPGHAALYLPDRAVLFTGDALVTLDRYTGRQGPRVPARAGLANGKQALASLDRLYDIEAKVLLPGHGEPWHGSPAEAVAQARAAGLA